jgi:hypothetical protein
VMFMFLDKTGLGMSRAWLSRSSVIHRADENAGDIL